MRVISGTAKGRRLKTLPGELVRPTASHVKEAIFNIIHFDIEGRHVLDLFAGSGQLGIEALSRGATSVTFVDMSAKVAENVRQNLTLCGFEGKVVIGESMSFLNGTAELFDIIFIDPPYGSPLLEKSLQKAFDICREGGIIVCESDHPIEGRQGRTYNYGRVYITIYENRDLSGQL